MRVGRIAYEGLARIVNQNGYKAIKANEQSLNIHYSKILNLSDCKFVANSVQFPFFHWTIRVPPIFLSTFFQAVTNKKIEKKKLEKFFEFSISATIQYPIFFSNTSFYSTISIFNYSNSCFQPQFNISTYTLNFYHWINAREWHLWSIYHMHLQ